MILPIKAVSGGANLKDIVKGAGEKALESLLSNVISKGRLTIADIKAALLEGLGDGIKPLS